MQAGAGKGRSLVSCLLTHLRLAFLLLQDSEGGAELAKKLVELYFTLFRLVIEGNFGRAGEARK